MARLITGSLTRCSGWSTVMWPLINHMTAAMKWHGNMHGASLITRRAVNVRQSPSRDADGSFIRGSESSAHPALRFKTTFQKTRWQKPKFSSNVSRLCLWNVLCLRIWEMLLLCWSHADARSATLSVVAFSCTGVILLGFSPRWQILFPWDKPQSEDDRLLCGSKPTVHRRYIAY